MKVVFSTSHGNFILNKWNFRISLMDLCKINKIPHQSISFYGKKGNELELIIGVHKKVEDFLQKYDEIIIKPDRNIDYSNIVSLNNQIKKDATPVSEYTFPSSDSCELHHFEFSQESCQKYVCNKVNEFLKIHVHVDPTKKIILGISGGGDSNTLIKAFVESNIVRRDQLIGVMMLGIPDWDLGRERAEAICRSNEIEFRIVDSKMINSLLGRKSDRDWVDDFEKEFPDADLEVLGTHCIRLALKYVGQQTKAQALVTGLNLEDILADCFLCISKGVLPTPFPVRQIDGFEIWHPLYQIPKKIIDGCFPKYSFQNYTERFPSKMKGRAIPYYLSQSMHGLIPGIEFDLLRGFKKLADQNTIQGYHDDDLGFMTVEKVHDELKSKWNKFIGI